VIIARYSFLEGQIYVTAHLWILLHHFLPSVILDVLAFLQAIVCESIKRK
jgi:hypothetical protein